MTVIELSKTITLHPSPENPTGEIKQLQLKEPRGEHFFKFGPPEVRFYSPEGTRIVEQMGVVRQYLEVCLVGADVALVLTQLSLADALKVKDAIIGFFDSAVAPPDSKKESTTSSSISE